jgi:hypothetical protein
MLRRVAKPIGRLQGQGLFVSKEFDCAVASATPHARIKSDGLSCPAFSDSAASVQDTRLQKHLESVVH